MRDPRDLRSFPTRRSSDLLDLTEKAVELLVRMLRDPRLKESDRARAADKLGEWGRGDALSATACDPHMDSYGRVAAAKSLGRSEEHTSELQSPCKFVCRLL